MDVLYHKLLHTIVIVELDRDARFLSKVAPYCNPSAEMERDGRFLPQQVAPYYSQIRDWPWCTFSATISCSIL